jgi:penicillin-binding protein 1C
VLTGNLFNMRLFKTVLPLLIVSAGVILFWFSIPVPLFNDPTCTVIEDRNGELLGARIADDGQWRFPFNKDVPEKFKQSIIYFEDRCFYWHPGVNPYSLLRAVLINIKSGKIISGGSTLTMQVIRLSRKGKERTIPEKIVEIYLALRLEAGAKKDHILALYSSNAPFGGNVVGLDAASWRYFGCSPSDLSWSEAATLAVLPNSPSLIHPGKNRNLLLTKRNRLLSKLYSSGKIDSVTYVLSVLEPLPDDPVPLPSLAPHLLSKVCQTNKGKRIRTTLVKSIQERAEIIVEEHHKTLKYNEIHNAACLVLEVETGDVLAYVGNTQNPKQLEHGSDVDIITAPRSTGSILKPLLFCLMLHEGSLLPGTLVPDIPTHYSGYTPENFSLTYDGAVPAKRALSKSLNIPAVRMLQQFGVERFHYWIKKLGMTTIDKPADHYGLSLILGGAEGTLWDITGIFCSLARILKHYNNYDGHYFESDLRSPNYIMDLSDRMNPEKAKRFGEGISFVDAGSIWLTLQSLMEVNRPENETGWKNFSSSDHVAWKTGTSFGFRDGWAIGTTPDYTVGIWAGNADGEGRPGLTGIQAAAPVLFDIFDILPSGKWFDIPYDELVRVPVCRQSGHRAGMYCNDIDSILIPVQGLNTTPCPYHIIVHLTADGKYRLNSECASIADMQHVSWFVLPPVQEFYYQSKNPEYKPLPPMYPDCNSYENIAEMDLIYPKENSRIYVPYELDGNKGQVVLEAAHRIHDATIYWHLDDQYIGATQYIHQIGISPAKGEHILTLVDESGNILQKKFEVLARKN